MSQKPILAHRCNRADYRKGPRDCRCQKNYTQRRALELIKCGEAVWRLKSDGSIDQGEIVLHALPLPKLTCRTIGAKDIVRAFVDGMKSEKCRIAIYSEVH